MNIRGVIFDLDYTLIDASKAIYNCIKHAAQTMGFPVPDFQTAAATIGLSLTATYTALTKDDNYERARFFATTFVQYAQTDKENYLKNTTLFATVLPLFKSIKANQQKIAIVTSKTRDCVNDVFGKFKLDQYFDFVIAGDEVAHPKPHPLSLELTLKALDINASEAIYIGDSTIDAEAANLAGINFVAVTTGQTPSANFAAFKCHAIIKDLSGLTPYLNHAVITAPGQNSIFNSIKQQNINTVPTEEPDGQSTYKQR